MIEDGSNQALDAAGDGEDVSSPPQDETPAEVTPPAEDEAGDEGEAPAPAEGEESAPARDASGKFIPKDSKAQTPVAGTAPQAGTDAAPASLSAEIKAQWGKLEAPVKAEFNRLTRESQNAVQKVQRELTDYKRDRQAIDPVLQPFENLCKQNGLYAPQMLHNYIEWSKLAETNPTQFLKAYCQRMNISLDQMVQGGTPDQVDPSVRSVVQQAIAPLQAQVQQYVGSQQAQVQQQANEALTAFSTAADAQGQPLRPHFEKVLPVMAQLWGEVKRQNPGMSNDQQLQAAYDAACRADPVIHRELVQREFDTKQNQAKQDAAKRSAAARAAMVSPGSSPPAASAGGKATASIADILSELTADADRIA